jgi:hypothetical protein
MTTTLLRLCPFITFPNINSKIKVLIVAQIESSLYEL